AMAQYTVGHGERLRAIEGRLRQHRGLFLAGNAYRGVGVPDCIRSGREAGEACVQLFWPSG
ncbi:MAG: FAD-dependent oxidoreductase, partial [Terriglobia bacterium]